MGIRKVLAIGGLALLTSCAVPMKVEQPRVERPNPEYVCELAEDKDDNVMNKDRYVVQYSDEGFTVGLYGAGKFEPEMTFRYDKLTFRSSITTKDESIVVENDGSLRNYWNSKKSRSYNVSEESAIVKRFQALKKKMDGARHLNAWEDLLFNFTHTRKNFNDFEVAYFKEGFRVESNGETYDYTLNGKACLKKAKVCATKGKVDSFGEKGLDCKVVKAGTKQRQKQSEFEIGKKKMNVEFFRKQWNKTLF